MTRAEATEYIAQTYGVSPEYPWPVHPSEAVFRHSGNRKWFAVMMGISRDKLGLEDKSAVDVINLKCGPLLQGSLMAEPGFFPAFHMNKTHWVSVALDGSAADETIKWIIDVSYQLTRGKG